MISQDQMRGTARASFLPDLTVIRHMGEPHDGKPISGLERLMQHSRVECCMGQLWISVSMGLALFSRLALSPMPLESRGVGDSCGVFNWVGFCSQCPFCLVQPDFHPVWGTCHPT